MIFRRRSDTPHVLLIRDRYQHWGFPKGHLEGEESPADAAVREVREETGLADVTLGPELQVIDWYFRFQGRLIHKFCHFFLIEAPTGEPVPQVAEGITDCVWLPLDEAIETISYDNARTVLRAAAAHLESGTLETSAPAGGAEAPA